MAEPAGKLSADHGAEELEPMCGIVGVVELSDPNVVRAMTNSIIHRGPDDEGSFVDEHVTLGMRRLSIIDPSPLGHQPMSNEDGTVWIVYNGEIYNYQELNLELQRKGHVIKSNCDTETIIHLYEEYGKNCVHHLRGMFAFAIWDKRSQSLFAARDRLGLKPFYYAQVGQKLVFASELKAIVASGLIPKVVSPTAISHFVSFGTIPGPLTIWQDTHALLPGHRLTFHSSTLEIEQYWDAQPTLSESVRCALSEQDIVRETRRLLEEAVRIRLMSDVPLGAFLSGGVDSSIIVGLMSRFSSQPVRTFSVGYDVGLDTYDERRYALVAAKHFRTDHCQVVVTGQHVVSALDKMIWHMDQPSHDALNSYIVSQAAASSVKVALSGLGGDELFGGYSTFKYIALLSRFRPMCNVSPRWVGKIAVKLDQQLAMRYRAQWPVRIGLGIAGAYDTTASQVAAIRFFYSDFEKQNLFAADFQACLHHADQSSDSLGWLKSLASHLPDDDWFNQVCYLELKSYMADVLLRDMDVMSMAHSLEVRVPLIDHKLVEFMISLSGRSKWNGSHDTKHLLLESTKDLLPPELLHRRKKGFALPMPIWLREHGFREIVEDCLSEHSVRERGIFNLRAIQQAKHEFYERQQFGNSGQTWLRVWIPTVLELWCRVCLDTLETGSAKGVSFEAQ